MKPANARRAQREFDVAAGDAMPEQRTLRPERPCKSLGEFVRFLTALDGIYGVKVRPVRRIEGNRFLL